jgi:GT2 family glycosyltransferase
MTPTASIVIPTRARPAYLDVALSSVVPQAQDAGAEVIVVSDGPDPASGEVAQLHRVRLVALPAARGINAARNAGVASARAELVIFIDDDVRAPAGWLDAVLKGAAARGDRDAFGGPIRAVLEGRALRTCGREPAPITTLDAGSEDRDVEHVWGANMAMRKRAFEAIGGFDETIGGSGDEADWLRRYRAGGGRIRYLSAAAIDHRRTAADATLPALARSAYRRGRAARRDDVRTGTAPGVTRELGTLLGCAWHVARRRCANGFVSGAHSAGRLRESIVPGPAR